MMAVMPIDDPVEVLLLVVGHRVVEYLDMNPGVAQADRDIVDHGGGFLDLVDDVDWRRGTWWNGLTRYTLAWRISSAVRTAAASSVCDPGAIGDCLTADSRLPISSSASNSFWCMLMVLSCKAICCSSNDFRCCCWPEISRLRK